MLLDFLVYKTRIKRVGKLKMMSIKDWLVYLFFFCHNLHPKLVTQNSKRFISWWSTWNGRCLAKKQEGKTHWKLVGPHLTTLVHHVWAMYLEPHHMFNTSFPMLPCINTRHVCWCPSKQPTKRKHLLLNNFYCVRNLLPCNSLCLEQG